VETNLAAANVSQARHREAEFDGLHAAAHRSHDDSDELYNGRRFRRGAQQARADDAGPGVARISLIKGGVNIKRADSGDTLGAAINAPLGVGDYLSTQPAARTEVQLADRTSLRVGAGTQLRFTNLEAASNALQLAAGTVELRLFGNDAAHPEIDTPNVVVRPTEKGRYRVSVDCDGNTLVAFFSFGGLSFGFGNIGWVPLAPYEPFNPWWGNGYGAPVFNRVTNITNVTNVTNITNINTITNINNYHNISAPGGMVAVNAANFKAGRFAHLTPVTPKELRAAKVVADILPIVPSRRNLAYAPSTAPVTNAIDAARFKGFKPLAPRFPIRMFAEQQAAVTNVVQRLTSPSEHPAESGGTTHDHATLHAASTWGTARPRPNELSPWDRFAPKAAQSQHRDATGRAAETMRPATLVTHPVNSAWDRFDHVTPSTRPNKSAVEESPRDRAHATTDPFARFDSRSLPKTRANTDQHTGVPPGYEARPASSQGRPASYGSRPPYESHAQPNHDGQRVPSAAHPVVPVPTTPYASHHQ